MYTHLLRGELRVLTMLNRGAATMKNNVRGSLGGAVGGRVLKDCKWHSQSISTHWEADIYHAKRKEKKKERKRKIPRA